VLRVFLSLSAFLAVEVGFVPQFISCSSSALRLEVLQILALNPLSTYLDPGKNRELCCHLLLLAGPQLGSFRNLSSAGVVAGPVIGRPWQAERSPVDLPEWCGGLVYPVGRPLDTRGPAPKFANSYGSPE